MAVRGTRPKYIRGELHSIFSTVEFGMAPFVPFSSRWAMQLSSLPSRDAEGTPTGRPPNFEISPPSAATAADPAWQRNMDAFAKAGYNFIDDFLDRAPEQAMKNASAKLASELAAMLSDEPIYKSIDGTREEIEERIVIEYANANNIRWKEGKGNELTLEDLGVTRNWEVDASLAGKETLDMAAKTEKEAEYLEYSLNRMAVHFGKDFVEGVQGIEVTKETKSKFMQQVFTATDVALSLAERLEITGEAFAKYVMDEYNKVNKGPVDVARRLIEDTWPGGKKKGSSGWIEGGVGGLASDIAHSAGEETPAFIAKQVLGRFAQIAQNVGSINAGYLYHIPLVEREPVWNPVTGKFAKGHTYGRGGKSYTIGFVVLRPQFGGKYTTSITGINVSTQIINMADLWMQGQGPISEEDFQSMMEAAEDVGYGTFAQWLLWDLAMSARDGEVQMSAAADDLTARLDREYYLGAHMRGALFGSSLWTMIDSISRGAVGGAPARVQAVQVLTSQEVQNSIQKQFEDFLDTKKNKSLEKTLKRFYEKAVKKSDAATTLWKSGGGLNVSEDYMDLMFRRGNILYDSPESRYGEKVGIPWFLHAGKSGTDFERFKLRSSKGTIPFLKRIFSGGEMDKNIMRGETYKRARKIYKDLDWREAQVWSKGISAKTLAFEQAIGGL